MANNISSIFFSKLPSPIGWAQPQVLAVLEVGHGARELQASVVQSLSLHSRRWGEDLSGRFLPVHTWSGCVWCFHGLGATWAPNFLTPTTTEVTWHISQPWV